MSAQGSSSVIFPNSQALGPKPHVTMSNTNLYSTMLFIFVIPLLGKVKKEFFSEDLITGIQFSHGF